MHKGERQNRPFSEYGMPQTIRHIVDNCLQTHFNGSLEKLHKADVNAVKWMEDLEL